MTRLATQLVFGMLGFVVVAVTAVLLANQSATVGFISLLIGILGLLIGLASGAFALTAFDRVRTIRSTIALAGPSRAGKTVFANVLSDRLMEGALDGLYFVPEAKTAQHVYRSIRGIRNLEWPAATDREDLFRYQGRIALASKSLLDKIRRVEYRVEIGDSAGENWDELAREERGETQPMLIETSFFQYVSEDSDALMYFVPADVILADSARTQQMADDLLSTVQLLRSIQGGNPKDSLKKPIALIISKSDLFRESEYRRVEDILLDGVRETPEDDATSRLSEFDKSMVHLLRVKIALGRRINSFRCFLISSVAAISPKLAAEAHQMYSLENRRSTYEDDSEIYEELSTDFRRPLAWILSRIDSTE